MINMKVMVFVPLSNYLQLSTSLNLILATVAVGGRICSHVVALCAAADQEHF